MDLDINGLEVLAPEECIQLLHTHSLGRIAVTSGALPVILPVNYLVSDHGIVIRTRRGTRLAAATRNAIVAFETDEIAEDGRSGWSVMVQGIAREIDHVDAGAAGRESDLAPWLDPKHSRHVSISIDVVSGRRIRFDGAA